MTARNVQDIVRDLVNDTTVRPKVPYAPSVVAPTHHDHSASLTDRALGAVVQFEAWRVQHQDEIATTQQHRLEVIHNIFRKWFGEFYDTDVLNTVLAAAASHWLDGDPIWLLVVGGPGDSKTETISTLRHIEWPAGPPAGWPQSASPVYIVDSISSAGALLSGLGQKDRDSDSTKGLLRELPQESIVIFKDFTAILSLGRDARASVLSALRSVYDGYFSRSVGGGGGRTESWEGRWTVIAACTSAVDTTERDASAKMGERFVLTRLHDDAARRNDSSRSASAALGREHEMRRELAAAIRALFRVVLEPLGPKATKALTGYTGPTGPTFTKLLTAPQPPADIIERISDVVDLCTRARSAVEYSRSGTEVVDVHALEMPTRMQKQLLQLWRGATVIGLGSSALGVALRCAIDSIPPRRTAVLRCVAQHGAVSESKCAQLLQHPLTSVRRELQALQMLGVLRVRAQQTGALFPQHVNNYEFSDAIAPYARAVIGTYIP